MKSYIDYVFRVACTNISEHEKQNSSNIVLVRSQFVQLLKQYRSCLYTISMKVILSYKPIMFSLSWNLHFCSKMLLSFSDISLFFASNKLQRLTTCLHVQPEEINNFYKMSLVSYFSIISGIWYCIERQSCSMQ